MPAQVQNKKRKLQDISNTKKTSGQAKQGAKSNQGKLDRRQKSSEKEEKGQEAISKRVKPNKKESELVKEVSDEVNLQDELVSQVIFKDLFSLYGKPLDLVLDTFVALADIQPQKLKTIVDEILTNSNTSEESVTRTLFLYFFELMGLEKSDSLLYMCSFIAKNSSEKKIQEMIDQEELDISFDKLVFFNQDKKSVVQKKLLKKFCKIFVADVVDGLPQKENYLTSIVEKVCILQKNSKRLVRFTFTYIGLYLYKFILSQTHELKEVEIQLQKKTQNEKKLKLESQKSAKQVETISQAIGIMEACTDTIFQHLLQKRAADCQEMIRRCVYDFLLQLEKGEVTEAFNKSNPLIFEVVFNSLRDSEVQIRRTGLNLITSLIENASEKDTFELLETQVQKNKLQILKMALTAQDSSKQLDAATSTKCIALFQKMYELTPKVLNEDQIKMLVNLVHFPAQTVKEEVASFLLTISDEFDDAKSLLEIQKGIAASSSEDELRINFNEEPTKSQKQILKLVQVFERHIQTRAQYIANLKQDKEAEITLVELEQEEVESIMLRESEERAMLLFQCFTKKTSVIYDVQSLCELLKKEGLKEQTQESIAHMIHLALKYIQFFRTNSSKDLQATFNKYNELATSYLKLTTINELLQTFRVNLNLVEPLLRSVALIGKQLEKGEDKEANEGVSRDLTHLLLKLINKTDVDGNPQSESILKLSIKGLVNLQTSFPPIQQELQSLFFEFGDNIKQKVTPSLFKDNQVNHAGLQYLHKYSILLSQVNLRDISDSDYLRSSVGWAITNLTPIIIDNAEALLTLNKRQLNNLLQIPFSHLEQLLHDSKIEAGHIKFQQSMIIELLDFYQSMHQLLASNEFLQVSVFAFIIETILMTSSDSVLQVNQAMLFNFSDHEKLQLFLTQMIQGVSARCRCNDTVVHEQFQQLLRLFMQDTQALMSPLGVEFLIHFATIKDQHILKDIRKLFNYYKSRDAIVPETKKSIFYQLVAKTVFTLYQVPEEKLIRILDQPKNELAAEMKAKGLELDGLSLESYIKARACQNLVKNTMNSIALRLIQNRSTPNTKVTTKQQDEIAFSKFMEDVCRFALRDKSTIPMLIVVQSLFNKNFVSQAQQQSIVKGLQNYNHKVQELLQMSEAESKVLDFLLSQLETKAKLPKQTKKERGSEEKSPKDDSMHQSSEKEQEKKHVGISKDDIGKKRKAYSEEANEVENIDTTNKKEGKSLPRKKEAASRKQRKNK